MSGIVLHFMTSMEMLSPAEASQIRSEFPGLDTRMREDEIPTCVPFCSKKIFNEDIGFEPLQKK